MSNRTDRSKSWRQRIRQHFLRRGRDQDGDSRGHDQGLPLTSVPVAEKDVEEKRGRDAAGQAMSFIHSPRAAESVELNPDWIDIDTLRLWLQVCDSQHGDQCKLSQATGYPRWLVDVERSCLVAAAPTDRYVALSYVWGQVACVRALRDNLEELQQPGSLSDTRDDIAIPRTIRDAIRLTTLLGERLLWVDSLCIVQDDVESKHAQLNEMASIYANAYVTLIAANGWDANHGLRGIRGVTESRMLSPNGNQDILESLQPYSTIWYSRGWTFQELIFSRRKIMFQYQMAIWECACGVWHEATPPSEMMPETGPLQSADSYKQPDERQPPGFVSCTPFEVKPNLDWPNLRQYMNLVRNYNDRQLTFPEDIISGFSGVLTMLSSVFVGGFICGLPEMFFDIALLWQPASPLERRVSSNNTSSTPLPSWSWVGWRGDIDQDSWSSGCIRLERRRRGRETSSFHCETKPVCQWSCGDGTTWRRLDISHHKYVEDRKHYITAAKELPNQWSMLQNEKDGYSFIHTSFPTTNFYYPVAIGAAGTQSINDSSHLLSFRARRLGLHIGGQLYKSNINCSQRLLLGKEHEPCGVVLLNIAPTFITKPKQDPLIGTPCELIAVSDGSQPTYFFPFNEFTLMFEVRTKDEVARYYNALWIEWIDGIAYRKALGQVSKAYWDKCPEEWIDVVLG